MDGADFGFCGSAYEAPNYRQDTQRLVNWYLEKSEDSKSKMPTTLLGAPGLDPLMSLGIGPVRGSWVLPGGQTAIAVCAERVYRIDVTVPPSQLQIAQFSTTQVGTLLTNSGPVCIRDNGAGRYAVLVDGPNGYYYRIDGAGSFAFEGTPISGNATLGYSGTLPTQIVIGSAITGTGIAPGSTIIAVSPSLGQITLSLPATSSPGAVSLTVTLAAFARITDPSFLGADRVAFIDGWLIFNQPGTQNFYTTAPVPYTLLFDGSFFAKNDTNSDNLVTLSDNNRELWLIGEVHTEIWFDGGGAQFAFQRIPGASPPIGCAAKHSITRFGDTLVWLGKNREGENIVVQTQQYTWGRISNHALEAAIASYPQVEDAVGYAYQDIGHLFYVLSFPTADVTWVFDASTQEWHERASYDSSTAQFHRHRSNCYMNFQNLRLVGDYQSGQIHNMSRKVYTDAGEPLISIRRCQPVWSRTDRKRVFHSALQIEFSPGVGLQTGQGSSPQAMMRMSDDGGATFGTERWQGIGKAGEMKNRAIWRRLGHARDRVYEVRYSDPTPRDVVGATLMAQGSE